MWHASEFLITNKKKEILITIQKEGNIIFASLQRFECKKKEGQRIHFKRAIAVGLLDMSYVTFYSVPALITFKITKYISRFCNNFSGEIKPKGLRLTT